MLFKEDVYMWFKQCESHRRVEFVCGILNMCLPLELKFIRTFVENLGKRDDRVIESETKSHKFNDLKQLGKVLDERTRSKLIICLALLEANNQTCSKLLYDCLINSLNNCENDEYLANTSHPDKECYNKEMQLIFTMMIHHPAFKYDEVKQASEKLTLLESYEEKTADCWTHGGPCPIKMGNNQSSHHLSNLPNEGSQVMEACDSGLSIGTEPEGEILSDHSCFPNQSEQLFPLSVCNSIMVPDKTEENKRKDNLWQNSGSMLPGPVVNGPMPCKATATPIDSVKLSVKDLNVAPTQGAVNSSSGESLNMAGVAAVPTAYIYNSSIYDRTALEVPPPATPSVAKREPASSQRPQTSDAASPSTAKPLWIGSVSNPAVSSTYVSSLQQSQVASSKMVTSIVTTSPGCHESSLSSEVITSVVVSRTTARPAPLPRQLSSSSSSSSHPSSPAMISGPKSSRYGLPTNRRLPNDKLNRQSKVAAQSVKQDELSSIISGPLSNTISFIPSIEDSNVVSTSQPVVAPEESMANFKFIPQSSAKDAGTSLTTTLTTTVAISSFQTTPAKNLESSQVVVAYPNCCSNSNHFKYLHSNDIERKTSRVETKGSPRPASVKSSQPPHVGNFAATLTGPVMPAGSAPFLASSSSSRMPAAFTFYPPNTGPIMKANSNGYYPSKNNPVRLNGKSHYSAHRRNGRGDVAEGHQTTMENSTSSSQYSSPSQTPSPDIKKPDKSDTADNTGEMSEAGCYSVASTQSFPDNNSPPPVYHQYQAPPNHPRHRYMSFPQQSMGFIPSYPHHPQGMYRYPIPNHHLMIGSQRPPPPSGADKSNREATPPSVNGTMEASAKAEVSPAPSVNLSRKSSSASPPGHVPDGPGPMAHPKHIGHGPLPFNGPNYQMFTAPFFTHVPGFVPGHASLGNGFVSQMPPNFSLPPMTEIMYQSPPYPMMGAAPSAGTAAGVPPYQAVLSAKPKRSLTCYNCGQVGHMGSDCNESSIMELTKCT